MSVEQQKQFLTTLLDEMDSKKIEAYRRAKADKQEHNFTMSRRSVRKGLRDYLKTQNLSKKDYDDILSKTDKYVKQFIKAVKKECARLAGKDNTVTAVGVNTAVKISYNFEIKNGKSRYDKIGGTDGVYAKRLKVFKVQFADVYGKEVKTKDLLQLSHAEFEGIIESAVSSAIDTAVASQAAIGRAEAKNFLRGRGIDLKVLRDTKTTTMNVELASADENEKDNKASKASPSQFVVVQRLDKPVLLAVVARVLVTHLHRLLDIGPSGRPSTSSPSSQPLRNPSASWAPSNQPSGAPRLSVIPTS